MGVLAQLLLKFVADTGQAERKIANFEKFYGRMADVVIKRAIGTETVYAGITKAIDAVGNAIKGMAEGKSAIDAVTESFREMGRQLPGIIGSAYRLGETISDLAVSQNTMNSLFGVDTMTGGGGPDKFEAFQQLKAARAAEAMADAEKKLNDEIARQRGLVEDLLTPAWEKHMDRLKALKFLLAEGAIDQDRFNDAMEKLNRAPSVDRMIEGLREELDAMQRTSEQMAVMAALREGASEAQIKEIRQIYDMIDALNEQADAERRLADQERQRQSLLAEFMTDEERRKKKLEELQQALQDGIITEEEYDNAVKTMNERDKPSRTRAILTATNERVYDRALPEARAQEVTDKAIEKNTKATADAGVQQIGLLGQIRDGIAALAFETLDVPV